MTDISPRQKGAIVVWLVGLLVYLLAVFHRSSLAVAGLAATERFDISAAQLSAFTMLQLLVYTAMQIPVGLLLDRFGSRRIMLTGLLTLTAAQTLFAVADTYAVALVARLFVGMGDAMIFVCVLRLVNTWFAPRRIPFFTQMTGVIGQLGGIIAAIPMTLALRELGWTKAYLLAAGLGIVLLLALLAFIRDSPLERSASGPAMSLTTIRRSLAESWEHPGTRLGLWTHFTTQFSATTLGLLWGYPFFVRGENLSPGQAGALLTILVVAVMAAGPVLAWFITRHPWHRSTLVLAIVATIVVMWSVVLMWPGDAPFVGPGAVDGRCRRRRSGVNDRLRLRSLVQSSAPDGCCDRHHQSGRLLRQSHPGDCDRSDPRLAHPRRQHGVHAVGLPVGDVIPVPPVGDRPGADLALSGAGAGQDHARGA